MYGNKKKALEQHIKISGSEKMVAELCLMWKRKIGKRIYDVWLKSQPKIISHM